MEKKYEVRFYKGNYYWRQKQANQDQCVAYVEHHFNSAINSLANYSLVVTGRSASETSKSWGRWYAKQVGREFMVPLSGDRGILVGGYNGRGNANLKGTVMPAILLEPLFASNPEQAELIRSAEAQDKLAKVLVDSIVEFFPEGGLIAFSVGHKYKTSRPNDRGAPLHGGGVEADFAEIVLEKAKHLLENYKPPEQVEPAQEFEEEEYPPDNDIRVIKDGKELWLHTDVDEDDDVMWDEENRILYVTTMSSAGTPQLSNH